MASNVPKNILLRGDPQHREAIAAGAVTPGHLIALNSAGKVVVHASAAGVSSLNFAREAEYVGRGIDIAYASDDHVPYYVCGAGDEVYAWLKNGQNVAIGAYLESGGDGSLQATTLATTNATTAAATPLAVAIEAVNNSGGGTGPNSAKRIKVRCL